MPGGSPGPACGRHMAPQRPSSVRTWDGLRGVSLGSQVAEDAPQMGIWQGLDWLPWDGPDTVQHPCPAALELRGLPCRTRRRPQETAPCGWGAASGTPSTGSPGGKNSCLGSQARPGQRLLEF